MKIHVRARRVAAVLAFAALLAPSAFASDDHDHGPAQSTPGGPALPRFQATSDAFELVGVVDGKNLRVWLDRFDDNAPVRGASIDLEIGGNKVALTEHAEGEFEATLASALAEGTTPVTATVTAGMVTDLLAADLDVHAAEAPAVAGARNWTRIAMWAGAGLLVIFLLIAAGRRAGAHLRLKRTA